MDQPGVRRLPDGVCNGGMLYDRTGESLSRFGLAGGLRMCISYILPDDSRQNEHHFPRHTPEQSGSHVRRVFLWRNDMNTQEIKTFSNNINHKILATARELFGCKGLVSKGEAFWIMENPEGVKLHHGFCLIYSPVSKVFRLRSDCHATPPKHFWPGHLPIYNQGRCEISFVESDDIHLVIHNFIKFIVTNKNFTSDYYTEGYVGPYCWTKKATETYNSYRKRHEQKI